MKTITRIIPVFLVVGFIFIFSPEVGNSSQLHGCCMVESECVGCDEGICGTSALYCEEAGSTVGDGACVNSPAGDFCDFTTIWDDFDGCCLIETNNCLEEISYRDCIDFQDPAIEGQIWFPEQSCNRVPQCTVRNVPALGEWGLIAIAGILGILAFIGIRRKKLTT